VDFSSEKIKNITQTVDRHTFVFISLFISLFQNNKHLRVHDDDDDDSRKRERKGFVATSRFRFYRGGHSCLLLCGA